MGRSCSISPRYLLGSGRLRPAASNSGTGLAPAGQSCKNDVSLRAVNSPRGRISRTRSWSYPGAQSVHFTGAGRWLRETLPSGKPKASV